MLQKISTHTMMSCHLMCSFWNLLWKWVRFPLPAIIIREYHRRFQFTSQQTTGEMQRICLKHLDTYPVSLVVPLLIDSSQSWRVQVIKTIFSRWLFERIHWPKQIIETLLKSKTWNFHDLRIISHRTTISHRNTIISKANLRHFRDKGLVSICFSRPGTAWHYDMLCFANAKT
jgi:hypothetical protein